MEPDQEIQFRVGDQYENEKGVFTVLSVRKNEMVIQWASGEEIQTTVELQRQIQQRRHWEQLQREKQAKKARSGSGKGRSARARQPFGGFKTSDFKNSAAGTTWRGRNQLGGAVTKLLPVSQYTFSSWAFGGEPEVHWTDVERYKKRDSQTQAKFFARVDPQHLYYGLYATRPDPKLRGTSNDWDALIDWLTASDGESALHSLALDHDLAIYDRYHGEFKVLVPLKKSWTFEGSKKKAIPDLSTYLATALEGERLDLEIARRINQKDVIDRGADIAADLAALFGQLLPLFRSVASR